MLISKLYQWLSENDFPSCYLPEDYLDFMENSNNRTFVYGEREYQFLEYDEIMEYYDAYMFPQFMPYAFPFAMDGCGNFYIFNLREIDRCVYAVAAGNKGWEKDECIKVADNFTECLGQKYSLDEIL